MFCLFKVKTPTSYSFGFGASLDDHALLQPDHPQGSKGNGIKPQPVWFIVGRLVKIKISDKSEVALAGKGNDF